MRSNYLEFELHKDKGSAFIKPGEITSFSPAPEGGARLVTRQKQIFYVEESVNDVNSMILLYFEKLKEGH